MTRRAAATGDGLPPTELAETQPAQPWGASHDHIGPYRLLDKLGADGMGVFKRLQEHNVHLNDDGFELVSIVTEELVSERSYNEPELFCSTVEAVADAATACAPPRP